MKHFVFAIALLFLLCENNSLEAVDTSSGLIGVWQLNATKISPGGPVAEWTIVENGQIYQFGTDGAYSLTNVENNDSGFFKLEDAILTLTSNQDDITAQQFYVSKADGNLILGFVGCIEECSFRYKKIER